MSYGSDRPETSYNASLRQLNQAARELEKVNLQFRQFLDELDGWAAQATDLQSPFHDDNTAHHQPCKEPQPERTTPYVLPQEPLPAPNPTNRPPLPLTPAALVECLTTPASSQPTLRTIDNNLPQQSCPELQCDGAPQSQCDDPPQYVPKITASGPEPSKSISTPHSATIPD